MPESSTQQIVSDPVLSNFELGLRRLYYPLGLPLELQTNSQNVIDAASEAWGSFSQSFEIAPMRLALGVKEGAEAGPLPVRSSFLAREHLMAIIMDADNFVMCDYQQAFSFGWITPALASDYAKLRYHLLTGAAMTMAEHLALAPLHGALIMS